MLSFKIPIPNRDAASQELIDMKQVEFGYLKMKRKIHNLPIKVNFIKDIISKINWDNKFVILYDGCVYVYSNNLDKKPERSFSLFGFTQVTHVVEKAYKMSWIFKVACFINEQVKSYYFAATCEKEMNKWMLDFKKEMAKANNIQLKEEELVSSNRTSLEKPILADKILDEFKNSKEFLEDIMEADSDDEYSYISAILPDESKSKGNKISNSSSSSHTENEHLKPVSTSENSQTTRERPSLPLKKGIQSPNVVSKSPSEVESKGQPELYKKPCPDLPTDANSGGKLNLTPPPNDNKSIMPKRPSMKVSPILQKNLEDEARWEGGAVEGQMLLVSNSYEGSYMIRKGTVEDNDVLLVFNSSQLKKFRIMQNDICMYCLDPNGITFETIHELLYYYRHNNLPNKDFKLIKSYSEL